MMFDAEISTEQRYWWRIALELRLRQCHGDAFQDFFSIVMGHLHGDDFVRVRPFGQLGDKGCDGYLVSTGQVFQCYGAMNGETHQVARLTKKMKDDFATAKTKLDGIMQEWHMVLNLVDGLPIEAVQALVELRAANPNIKFGFISKEGLEERVFTLGAERIALLLGPAATPADAKNLDVATLKALVNELVMTDLPPLEETDLRPVPVGKLSHNELPWHWQLFVRGGWANAPIVAGYFERHPDPLRGGQVAMLFKTRYEGLKAQNLKPGDIMAALLETVTGIGNVTPQQQVVAQALLTHVFENCDIFEREPATAQI